MLYTVLVKVFTRSPMTYSKVMHAKSFRDLFLTWDLNDILDINKLRVNAIVLLALSVMLRPSDIEFKETV